MHAATLAHPRAEHNELRRLSMTGDRTARDEKACFTEKDRFGLYAGPTGIEDHILEAESPPEQL